jgi:hypothetical protein
MTTNLPSDVVKRLTFELIQEEIAAMLSVPDDELDADQQAALDEYLDELATLEKSKVDAFGQFMKLQSAYAEAAAEEAKRLAKRAKAAENRLAFLKGKYLDIMQSQNRKKVKGDIYSLSIREAQSVAVTALIDELPAIYVRVKTTKEPDKLTIKEALKGGLEIPGCSLQPSYSLQIQ